MKLSILDQAPIPSGKTSQDALESAVELAKLGEELGYTRFWIAEHHDLFGLACPNPDVMLGVIGSRTNHIRIGAGAVLLPYYKPFRVAETYNLLATLFPNRIDLGLGRAPGGSAEVSQALSDNYLAQVKEYPNDIEDLLGFLHNHHQADEIYGKIAPTPVPDTPPQTWTLGTSEKSAALAAEKGLDYAFGHFMTDKDGPEIVQTYRKTFAENHDRQGHVIVAISVICAATNEKAEELASSFFLWQINQEKPVHDHTVPSVAEAQGHDFSNEEKQKIEGMRQNMIIGDPARVHDEVTALQAKYDADELMVVTITHDKEAKFESYRLLKEAFAE